MSKREWTDRFLEGCAWGMLLIWWGISFVRGLLPNGVDAAGTGIILLGMSLVRKIMGVPARGFAVGLGILTVIWGALDMSQSVFHLGTCGRRRSGGDLRAAFGCGAGESHRRLRRADR